MCKNYDHSSQKNKKSGELEQMKAEMKCLKENADFLLSAPLTLLLPGFRLNQNEHAATVHGQLHLKHE